MLPRLSFTTAETDSNPFGSSYKCYVKEKSRAVRGTGTFLSSPPWLVSLTEH